MDERSEQRPELGTTEAAVRSCVNLIALATHTDEEHLAYWLDCYYQLRVAHERRASTPTFHEFMEMFGGPSTTSSPAEDVKSTQPAARQMPHDVEAEEGERPEPPAAQKKNRAPLTVSERRKLQNAEKEKKRIQGKSDWREFKRATFARLQEARTAGLTVAQIAAAYGALTENTVLDILNAAPRPIEDYRALAAALDKLAEI